MQLAQYFIGSFLLGAGLGNQFGYAGAAMGVGMILILGFASDRIIERCERRR